MKKIDIPGWKKEQAVLHQKEEERTAQYKPLREKARSDAGREILGGNCKKA